MWKILRTAMSSNQSEECLLVDLTLPFVDRFFKTTPDSKITGIDDILKKFFDCIFISQSLNSTQIERAKRMILQSLEYKNDRDVLHYILQQSKELLSSSVCSLNFAFDLIDFLKEVFNLLSNQYREREEERPIEKAMIQSSLKSLFPEPEEWQQLCNDLSTLPVTEARLRGQFSLIEMPPNEPTMVEDYLHFPRISMLVTSILNEVISIDEIIEAKDNETITFIVYSLHSMIYLKRMTYLNNLLCHVSRRDYFIQFGSQ